MGKLDELRRTAGANVTESASKRDASVAAPVLPSLTTARMAGTARSKNAMEIEVSRIVPDPEQPREEFDEAALTRLADSLKTRGQLQPIRVRWDEGQGAYVLICGERRWRAARMAGLMTLTCIVAEGAPDAGELLALQLIENCVREDLAPIEQAKAYRTLMARMSWSGNRLAQELGINQTSVVQALALLELPAPVQERVEAGELAPSTAYQISKITDPEERTALAERVVAEKLTRAETVKAVKAVASKGRGAKAKSKAPRKVTERVFRTSAGRVTIENRKGLDDSIILAALDEIRAILAGTEERDAA
jgi:ParB family chromosome partitioning protein